MGMEKHLRNFLNVLRNDETLLRLLYYPPENIAEDIKDPLDSSLQNILDMDITERWKIIDDRILVTSKSSDLDSKKICRIYVYAGRRTPQRNYLVSNQEIKVEIFCHNDFEVDLRSLRISDRINELLFDERITGFGKVKYEGGNVISAPKDYVGYFHVYEFGSANK